MKIQLKEASSRAGFATALPSYHPVGYSLEQLQYSSGIFSGEYTSKSNATLAYTVTQRSTSWSSQELLAQYVALNTPNYHVVQLGSLTIYLYGNGAATWVRNSVWYQITSDGSLNQSQLIDMANSL